MQKEGKLLKDLVNVMKSLLQSLGAFFFFFFPSAAWLSLLQVEVSPGRHLPNPCGERSLERRWRKTSGPEWSGDASSSLAECGSAKKRCVLPAEAPSAQRRLVVLYLAHVT